MSQLTMSAALNGSPTLFSVGFDLASVGYSVHEHFVSGAACSYAETQPRTPDGRWPVELAGTADFTTRVVIYRPTDAARGNGTVVVEWLNVTGGLDVPAVWMATHRHLIRDGYTWIGVSVQQVGIDGGGVMPGFGLRQTTPERYAALRHPGDAHSYDMFTQVARAFPAILLERYGLAVDRVVATGASQSAFHLVTYINAIDGREEAFDAFLLQGRAGAAAPITGLDTSALSSSRPGDVVAARVRLRGRDRIREDLRVPVMVVQSETDVFGRLAYLPARQPDSERFRLWEVAGSAHCDTYFMCASPHDSGALPGPDLAALIARADASGMPTELPINSGPQMHYVLQRAFDALDRWTRHGTAPPSAPRFEVDRDGTLAVDDIGVALGGIRTPWVEAPTATLSGLGQPGPMTELFGTTRRLDRSVLAARYPGGRDEYVDRFRRATRAAAEAGFLLPADVPEIEGLGAAAWPTK